MNTPPPRRLHEMVWIPKTKTTLLFGGVSMLGDTWEYVLLTPATYSSFGEGCQGSAGTPELTSDERPWLGEDFSMQLTGTAPNSVSLLLVGFSNLTWGPLVLPFSLDSFGLKGCTAYTSADVAIPLLSNATGTAVWNISVPNDPGVLGLGMADLAMVGDPNDLGTTLRRAHAA